MVPYVHKAQQALFAPHPELDPDSVQAEMDQYADCYIDPEKLPEDEIRSALAVVTGSLGLSFPRTADAMRRAVKVAKGAGTTVREPATSSLVRVCLRYHLSIGLVGPCPSRMRYGVRWHGTSLPAVTGRRQAQTIASDQCSAHPAS